MSERRTLTPLAIVALFVSLAEVVAGFVAAQSDGFIQLLLALFVIIFPLLFASAFFFILWHRTWVLYHPGEFPKRTGPKAFRQAMEVRLRTSAALDVALQNGVHKALESMGVGEHRSAIGSTKSRDGRADKLLESVRSSTFITLDTTTFDESNGKVTRVLFSDFESVGLLLRFIWFSLDGSVPQHSYGEHWVIRDFDRQIILWDIGSRFAREHLNREWDTRTLGEVGIHPGTKLEVLRLDPNDHSMHDRAQDVGVAVS